MHGGQVVIIVLGDPQQHVHGPHGLAVAGMRRGVLEAMGGKGHHAPEEGLPLQFELLEHVARPPQAMPVKLDLLVLQVDGAEAGTHRLEIGDTLLEAVLQGEQVPQVIEHAPPSTDAQAKRAGRAMLQQAAQAIRGAANPFDQHGQLINTTPVIELTSGPGDGSHHGNDTDGRATAGGARRLWQAYFCDIRLTLAIPARFRVHPHG